MYRKCSDCPLPHVRNKRGCLKSLKIHFLLSEVLCDYSVNLCVTQIIKNLHREHGGNTEGHRGLLRQPHFIMPVQQYLSCVAPGILI
jgi:hypothetical protein